MDQPWGIAFCINGVAMGIANSSNHCVHVFDGQDQLLKRRGRNNCQFKNPCGVTLDSDSKLYVTDH